MEKGFKLSVVTGDETVFEGQVSSVNLPTGFGSVGILRGHAPMLCAVSRGTLRALQDGESLRILVGDGVASVAEGELTVLVSDGKLE